MQIRVLLMALAINLAGPSAADAAGPDGALTDADAQAIRRLIRAQLAAFDRDDAAAAFRLAAPSLQEKYGTPEAYLERIRSGYPPVYRPHSYRFAGLAMTPWGLGQLMQVTSQDGEPVTALHLMERQEDGGWRAAGCLLFRPHETSTIAQA